MVPSGIYFNFWMALTRSGSKIQKSLYGPSTALLQSILQLKTGFQYCNLIFFIETDCAVL